MASLNIAPASCSGEFCGSSINGYRMRCPHRMNQLTVTRTAPDRHRPSLCTSAKLSIQCSIAGDPDLAHAYVVSRRALSGGVISKRMVTRKPNVSEGFGV